MSESFIRLVFILCVFHILSCNSEKEQRLTYVDVRYVTQNAPNVGFLEVLLSGSPTGWPETGWSKVCASSPSDSNTALAKTVCYKYGYNNGVVYPTSNGPCAEVSCADTTSTTLKDCLVNVFEDTKPTLSVICYHDGDDFLAQSTPQQQSSISWKTSVNCDFENGTICGWSLSMYKAIQGQYVYQPDATLGTKKGYLLAPECPQTVIAESDKPRATSILVDSCLGYTKFCLVFMSLTPDPTFQPPRLNVQVLSNDDKVMWSATWTSPRHAEWVVNALNFAVQPPFRVQFEASCKEESQVFLDGIYLATGRCPLYAEEYCFNSGTVMKPYEEPYCKCADGWTKGRWCEMTACNTAGQIRISIIVMGAFAIITRIFTQIIFVNGL